MTTESTLDRLRAANPVSPSDQSGPGTDSLLLMIDERNASMSASEERKAIKGVPDLTGPPPQRGRGWMVAIAVFAVITVGGVVLAMATSSGDSVAPAAPSPSTTEAAPATTVAPSTTVAPAAAPSTTITTTTEPAAVSVFEATLTWDGSMCSYEGPASVTVGDTIRLLTMNTGEADASYELHYLPTGITMEDVDDHYDVMLGNVFSADSFSVVPPFIWIDVEDIDLVEAGGSLTFDVTLDTAREHIFVCVAGELLAGDPDLAVPIDNAPQSVIVNE